MKKQPLTVRPRGVTLRDFAIFQVKLLMDGTKDFVAFWLSIVAIILASCVFTVIFFVFEL